jgi:hypothetical protein
MPRRSPSGRTLAPDDPRHGTLNAYSRLRCRCDECRRVAVANVPKHAKKRCTFCGKPCWSGHKSHTFVRSGRCQACSREARTPDHGTHGRYRKGCRCDQCLSAAAARRRPRVTQEPSFPADDPRHGTRNGYNNLGCRCDACRDAAVAYAARRVQRPCIRCGKPCWAGQQSPKSSGLDCATRVLARHAGQLRARPDRSCRG